MNLPSEFVKNIQAAFGEEGQHWLSRLPGLIAGARARWRLTNVEPVSNLSYNFVAFAESSLTAQRATDARQREYLRAPGGSENEVHVVLKIGVPHRELFSELAALKLFAGEGICQLLDSDEKKGMFLLERLKPGRMLSELDDDDERTHIAVDVMQRLWKSGPDAAAFEHRDPDSKFIQLSDWFEELKELRVEFDGDTGPFPKDIVERVESGLPGMFTGADVKLLHGDFHHFNLLSSDSGWLAIDPKGVIGPAGYEIGPLMINPWGGLSDWNKFRDQTLRRVSILSERLAWDREMIIQWSLAHAVLSAWWDYPSLGWEYSVNCAKVFSRIK